MYAEYNLLSAHLLAVLQDFDVSPANFIHYNYTITAYQANYKETLYPLSLNGLSPSAELCKPPRLQAQKGCRRINGASKLFALNIFDSDNSTAG